MVWYDERAKPYQRWAVSALRGPVASTTRYATEREANLAAGLPGGSTDPDYDPRKDRP